MFDKSMYIINGIHADIVKKLTSEIDENSQFKLFQRNIDVLFIAPLVGYLYGEQDTKDLSQNPIDPQSIKKINFEQLSHNRDILDFNYQLIMILHDKDKLDIQKRLDRAFKYNDGTKEKEECEKIYEGYILGGIKKLGEKLLSDAVTVDDYIMNMQNFLQEYNDRYYHEILDK